MFQKLLTEYAAGDNTDVGSRVESLPSVLDSGVQYTLSLCTVPGLLLVSLNCWLIGSDFSFIFGSPVPCFHALHRADIQEIWVDLDTKLCSSSEATVHNRVLLLSKALIIFQLVCLLAKCGKPRALTWGVRKTGVQTPV